jgi:CheY-like chemotaxis protein
MDGFEVARRIRGHDGIARTPIVMLTSAVVSDVTSRVRDLSIQGSLIKPVHPALLLKAIARALDATSKPGAAPGAPAPPVSEPDAAVSEPPKRVLLVEDNRVNQRVALRMLERRGFHVTIAGTGIEAVRLAAAERFDAILMDVQMPEMNGLDATRAIRALPRPESSGVPIIAMTAHAMAGDRERCLEAGMDDYLTKPIQPEALFATLGTALAAVDLSLKTAGSLR